MRKPVSCCLLMLISLCIYSQKLDLVITTKGDSIACKIDSINNDLLHISTYRDGKMTYAAIQSEQVFSYERNMFEEKEIKRIPGTMYFKLKTPKYIKDRIYHRSSSPYSVNNLNNASEEELQTLLNESLEKKRTGKILLSTGTAAIAVGTGLIFVQTSSTDFGYLGVLVIIPLGLLIDIIGLPIFLTGSTREKRVNYFINTNDQKKSLSISPTTFSVDYGNKTFSGFKLTINF